MLRTVRRRLPAVCIGRSLLCAVHCMPCLFLQMLVIFLSFSMILLFSASFNTRLLNYCFISGALYTFARPAVRKSRMPFAFTLKTYGFHYSANFVSAFSFCLCLISGQLFPECLLSTPTASRSTPAARRTATGHQSWPVCGSLPPEGGVLSFGGGVDSFLSSIFGEAFTL